MPRIHWFHVGLVLGFCLGVLVTALFQLTLGA